MGETLQKNKFCDQSQNFNLVNMEKKGRRFINSSFRFTESHSASTKTKLVIISETQNHFNCSYIVSNSYTSTPIDLSEKK